MSRKIFDMAANTYKEPGITIERMDPATLRALDEMRQMAQAAMWPFTICTSPDMPRNVAALVSSSGDLLGVMKIEGRNK